MDAKTMTQPLILTAQQAQELHTTGRTGYREKCEWQPPTPVVTIVWEGWSGKHFVEWKKELFFKNRKWRHELTPPRDTATAYAVKEPYWWHYESDSAVYQGEDSNLFHNPEVTFHEADEMPEHRVRQHARITNRKLIISAEELWWDMDLEKVEKA